MARGAAARAEPGSRHGNPGLHRRPGRGQSPCGAPGSAEARAALPRGGGRPRPAGEIRAIGRVLDGMTSGRTPPQLWRDTKVWGSSHQSLMQVNCRRFTKEQVEAALAHAARTDRMVKGLIRGDVWDELLQLTLRFAAGATQRYS